LDHANTNGCRTKYDGVSIRVRKKPPALPGVIVVMIQRKAADFNKPPAEPGADGNCKYNALHYITA
jgi:hypothetical protein